MWWHQLVICRCYANQVTIVKIKEYVASLLHFNPWGLLCDLKTYQQKQAIKAFLLKTLQVIRGRSQNKQEEVGPFIDFMNINDKVQFLAKSTKQWFFLMSQKLPTRFLLQFPTIVFCWMLCFDIQFYLQCILLSDAYTLGQAHKSLNTMWCKSWSCVHHHHHQKKKNNFWGSDIIIIINSSYHPGHVKVFS